MNGSAVAMQRSSTLYDALEAIAKQVWVDENHTFCLSPDVYTLTRAGNDQLNDLGRAINGCLPGIGRLAAIAASDNLARSKTWTMIHRALWNGIPAIYNSLGIARPNSIPGALKVDLLEGADGQFYVAEIDGYNERGVGYAITIAQMRDHLMPEAKTLQGVAEPYAKEILRHKRGNAALLVYANKERFYLPEFKVLQNELLRFGVELIVASEDEVAYIGESLIVRGRPENVSLLVYHPFMYDNNSFNLELASRYLAGEIEYILPPKPFFGSKAVLALLRNDENDPNLEAILRSQITEESLRLIRRFIPETYLISANSPRKKLPTDGFVLKKTIASGMKGTFFTDDHDFQTQLALAFRSHYSYVLQQEVETVVSEYRYLSNEGDETPVMCFTRLIAYYIGRQLVDVEVTALPRKAVHGARDCIFLGAVLTDH